MSTFSSPMSQTAPPLNLGRATYFETPKPHNLAGSRNPSSNTHVVSSTTQSHGNTHTRYSPENNQILLPDGTSYSSALGLETPTKPPAALLHSPSSVPPGNLATLGTTYRGDSEHGLGLDKAATTKRRWTWKRVWLWLALVLVVVAGVAVGVAVSLIKHRKTGGGASIRDISQATTSSAVVVQQATISSSAAVSAATSPDTAFNEATDPPPTPTPYASSTSSSSVARYPVPTDLQNETSNVDLLFQTDPLTTSTTSSPPGSSVCDYC